MSIPSVNYFSTRSVLWGRLIGVAVTVLAVLLLLPITAQAGTGTHNRIINIDGSSSTTNVTDSFQIEGFIQSFATTNNCPIENPENPGGLREFTTLTEVTGSQYRVRNLTESKNIIGWTNFNTQQVQGTPSPDSTGVCAQNLLSDMEDFDFTLNTGSFPQDGDTYRLFVKMNDNAGSTQDSIDFTMNQILAPTGSLSASPNPVDYNTSTTLTWSTTNADSCTATEGPGFNTGGDPNGSDESSNLTSDTTFSATCTGDGGSASVSVAVDVNPPPPPAPTASLSASPNPVDYNTTTTLSWSSSNADSCSGSGPGFSTGGNTSGSDESANLTSDTTFSVTCSGDGGTASDSVEVQVNPEPEVTYTLSIQKLGDGDGTYTSNPPGINCGGDCSQLYEEGTIVTITANPSDGSTFDGWGGHSDCSDGSVTMNGDRLCTGTFSQAPAGMFTLSITKDGDGSGTYTSNPPGINCGGDCQENYTEGTVVDLTATPSGNSTFDGWSGHSDCSDGSVTMSGNRSCTGTFTASGGGGNNDPFVTDMTVAPPASFCAPKPLVYNFSWIYQDQ